MLALLLVGTSANLCQAYPNFISYGYETCSSCHYNPLGNGPLNDYGRAVAASAISSPLLNPASWDDEKLAEQSAFFFSAPSQDWLRPSLSYRTLALRRNVGGTESSTRFIPMDLGGSIVLKFLPQDRLLLVTQLSLAPAPYGQQQSASQNYRSREHYIGYRLNPNSGVYVGLMDKAFGLRIPDHIAYSRQETRLGQNDQSHGIMFHYVNKKFELALQPFIGNLVQEKALRQRGITTMLEVSAAKGWRLGTSVLRSQSDYLNWLMWAVHSRVGFGYGNSLLFEAGMIERNYMYDSYSTTNTTSSYALAQMHYLFTRGYFGLLTLEWLRRDLTLAPYSVRIGPGLQFFPWQKVELRADAYRVLQFPEASATQNNWDFAGQMHLYF